MTDRQLCPICHRPVWLSPPDWKDGPRGISRHCRRHTARKRYVIRYNRENPATCGPWDIFDRQFGYVVESGYTKREATAAASFWNYRQYGPGPWRP